MATMRGQLVLLVALPCTAMCAKSDIIPLLKEHYTKDATISIEFEQSIYWSVREKTTRNTGTLSIAPGNRFRAELGRDHYVCNGTVSYHYNKENQQVVIRNLADLDRSTLPSYLLSHFLDNYTFSERNRSKEKVVLVAHSDSASESGYRSVEITATLSTGTITSLSFTDKNNNVHTFAFKKTVFDKRYPSGHFDFEVPPDADIIDHRN